jgi:hypothetical protein
MGPMPARWLCVCACVCVCVPGALPEGLSEATEDAATQDAGEAQTRFMPRPLAPRMNFDSKCEVDAYFSK